MRGSVGQPKSFSGAAKTFALFFCSNLVQQNSHTSQGLSKTNKRLAWHTDDSQALSRRTLWLGWAVMIATALELQHRETDNKHPAVSSLTLVAFPDTKHLYFIIESQRSFPTKAILRLSPSVDRTAPQLLNHVPEHLAHLLRSWLSRVVCGIS